MATRTVPIEVSARHCHLSPQDLGQLFGPGHQLTVRAEISQPHQFAAAETVQVVGPRGTIDRVRIIGPVRPETQVELSTTDCRLLGVDAPVLVSGDRKHSVGGVSLVGPHGTIPLRRGVLVTQRHLHIQPALAKQWKLRNGQTISVRAGTVRQVVFSNVAVRSRPGTDTLSFMLDTDEANAAGVRQGDRGEMIATRTS